MSASISLLIWVAFLVLWVRSYCRFDQVFYGLSSSKIPRDFVSSRGKIAWIDDSGDWPDVDVDVTVGPCRVQFCKGTETMPLEDYLAALPVSWKLFGIVRTWNSILIPIWMIAALFGVLPASILISRLRLSIPRAKGRCHLCSYNLL